MNTKHLFVRKAMFVLALALAAGCSRTVGFRTVDGVTGVPLNGVDVSSVSLHEDFLLGSSVNHTDIGKTGAEGDILVSGVSGSDHKDLLFRKDGYYQATVVLSGDLSHLNVSSGRVAPSVAPGRTSATEDGTSTVTIRMFRSNLPAAPLPMGMKPHDDPGDWHP